MILSLKVFSLIHLFGISDSARVLPHCMRLFIEIHRISRRTTGKMVRDPSTRIGIVCYLASFVFGGEQVWVRTLKSCGFAVWSEKSNEGLLPYGKTVNVPKTKTRVVIRLLT